VREICQNVPDEQASSQSSSVSIAECELVGRVEFVIIEEEVVAVVAVVAMLDWRLASGSKS